MPQSVRKAIESYSFVGFGSHTNQYHCSYLTVAVAVGMTKAECDTFLKRLDNVLSTIKKQSMQAKKIPDVKD